MLSRFFIDRPIFAWVVALFICLGGALTIPQLPIAQYPVIAPPSIALSTDIAHSISSMRLVMALAKVGPSASSAASSRSPPSGSAPM